MKSFSAAYYTSRKDSKIEKDSLVEQEHIKIVNAMKREYGINNFAILTESEQKCYRTMLNEMWNRENGLTEKGIAFLAEGAGNRINHLNPESTPEMIKEAFQQEVRANIIALVATLNSDTPNFEHAAKAKKLVEDKVNHKISSKDCKEWMYEVMAKYIQGKIRSFKF